MVIKIGGWILGNRKEGKEVTLEDVVPLHPNEYPAKRLKERLDARRSEFFEIEGQNHSNGMAHGLGGF